MPTLSNRLRAMEERSLISRVEPLFITARAHSEEIFIGAIVTEIKKEKHELDKKYPHVCFGCKSELSWEELLDRNISLWRKEVPIGNTKLKTINIDTRYLEKLWKSCIVEFYCCGCFKFEQISNLLNESIKELEDL